MKKRISTFLKTWSITFMGITSAQCMLVGISASDAPNMVAAIVFPTICATICTILTKKDK